MFFSTYVLSGHFPILSQYILFLFFKSPKLICSFCLSPQIWWSSIKRSCFHLKVLQSRRGKRQKPVAGLLPAWAGEKNTREGKREAFNPRPIVEPAREEIGTARPSTDRVKFRAMYEAINPNPLLNFLPIAQ